MNFVLNPCRPSKKFFDAKDRQKYKMNDIGTYIIIII